MRRKRRLVRIVFIMGMLSVNSLPDEFPKSWDDRDAKSAFASPSCPLAVQVTYRHTQQPALYECSLMGALTARCRLQLYRDNYTTKHAAPQCQQTRHDTLTWGNRRYRLPKTSRGETL